MSFKNVEEKIEFRDKFIYPRERELSRVLHLYHIDNAYMGTDKHTEIKFNLNIKRNIHLQPKKDEIIKSFMELDFVNDYYEKGRFIHIVHSLDVEQELYHFYGR